MALINKSGVEIQENNGMLTVSIPNNTFWVNKLGGFFNLLGPIFLFGLLEFLTREMSWDNFIGPELIILFAIVIFGLNGLRKSLACFYGIKKITIDEEYLTSTASLFGMGRKKRYRLEKVEALKIEPPDNIISNFMSEDLFAWNFKYGRKKVFLGLLREEDKRSIESHLDIIEQHEEINSEARNVEALGQERAKIEQDFGALSITIPSRKNWFVIIFLMIWLCGWLFGEISAIQHVFFSETPWFVNVFMLVWVSMWTIGGGIAILVLLWLLFGQEKIIVKGYLTKVENTILGVGLKKNYETHQIKHIAINQAPPKYGHYQQLPFGGAKIKFSYGMKTIKILREVDEAEARFILEKMKAFPKLLEEQFV